MSKKDLNAILSVVVIFSLILTLFFLRKSITWDDNSSSWGQFGDLIGGIIGTLFALLSIILLVGTLNHQISSGKEQSIENRTFQLISIHRDNVNQLVGKRKFFQEAVEIFWKIREKVDLCEEQLRKETIINADDEWQYSPLEKSNIAYLILFFGTKFTQNESLKDRICAMSYCSDLINKVIDELEDFELNSTTTIDVECGIQYAVGHYYRHLYQTVNYINDRKILKYKKKYSYIKTLRAQLSTYEQILFYINSISRLGEIWELQQEDENKKLVTKFNLIKNIPLGILKDIEPNYVYDLVIYESLYFEEYQQIINLRKQNNYS